LNKTDDSSFINLKEYVDENDYRISTQTDRRKATSSEVYARSSDINNYGLVQYNAAIHDLTESEDYVYLDIDSYNLSTLRGYGDVIGNKIVLCATSRNKNKIIDCGVVSMSSYIKQLYVDNEAKIVANIDYADVVSSFGGSNAKNIIECMSRAGVDVSTITQSDSELIRELVSRRNNLFSIHGIKFKESNYFKGILDRFPMVGLMSCNIYDTQRVFLTDYFKSMIELEVLRK